AREVMVEESLLFDFCIMSDGFKAMEI
ncbi:MAG: hypothetical protein ACI9RU_002390, partial [Litorivivens sp.]